MKKLFLAKILSFSILFNDASGFAFLGFLTKSSNLLS